MKNLWDQQRSEMGIKVLSCQEHFTGISGAALTKAVEPMQLRKGAHVARTENSDVSVTWISGARTPVAATSGWRCEKLVWAGLTGSSEKL